MCLVWAPVAAEIRVLAAVAGSALPKGRRARWRRGRSVSALAFVAGTAAHLCVLLVAVVRHVPFAPSLALAAITDAWDLIDDVPGISFAFGSASGLALVASAAGLLRRLALAVVLDLKFAPRGAGALSAAAGASHAKGAGGFGPSGGATRVRHPTHTPLAKHEPWDEHLCAACCTLLDR